MSDKSVAHRIDGADAPDREWVALGRQLAALLDLWPALLIGLGGLATLTWILALAWIVLQVVLWLAGLD